MAGSMGGVTTPSPPPRQALQDKAPPGGYAAIDIRRNVPKSVTTRGALGLFAAGGLVMAWGFYRVGTFNVHRRALKREHKENRLAIMPLLQAEEDARFVKQVSSLEQNVFLLGFFSFRSALCLTFRFAVFVLTCSGKRTKSGRRRR
jgi:GRIM-19 protein